MAIPTLGAALRQVHRLLGGGTIVGLSDTQLLERFVTAQDAAAFEALVALYGPMVLSVCRGVLDDPNDAEDAFQATFLILVKKASTFRGRVVLGGWLYQVAHRVAIRANVAAARRRAHERRAGQMAATSKASRAISDEHLRALHEEVLGLPEKLRLAIVLCDLQGIPQDRAAAELRLSERTLRRRLSEGRERLRHRLVRRGQAALGASAGMSVIGEAKAAVPAAWHAATVRAGLATAEAGLGASSISASALTLTREVLGQMMIQKLKLMALLMGGAGLMAWASAAALSPRGDEPAQAGPRRTGGPPRTAPHAEPRPQLDADPLDAVGTFPVAGRVLDPEGKPVAKAEIYVKNYSLDEMTASTGNTVSEQRSDRVAASDAEGRFHFDLEKSASDFPYRDFPVWHGAQIAAVAPGYGPTSVAAGSLLKVGEAALRMARDDVPIRGRVLDPQGRPVAGVTVYVREIIELGEKGRDSSLESGEVDRRHLVSQFSGPAWMGRQGQWTTDADGRFEIVGAGRDRVVCLEFRFIRVKRAPLSH